MHATSNAAYKRLYIIISKVTPQPYPYEYEYLHAFPKICTVCRLKDKRSARERCKQKGEN